MKNPDISYDDWWDKLHKLFQKNIGNFIEHVHLKMCEDG